jgi:hypothetical protein
MNGVFEERARNYNNEKVADPEKKMVRYSQLPLLIRYIHYYHI